MFRHCCNSSSVKELQLQSSGHCAIAGGGCLPHFCKEYSSGKMLKHIKSRIKLGKKKKKKLLTGELRKSDFSSEVFPCLLSEKRQIQTCALSLCLCMMTAACLLNIWDKGAFLFPILSNSLDSGTTTLNITECLPQQGRALPALRHSRSFLNSLQSLLIPLTVHGAGQSEISTHWSSHHYLLCTA